MVKVGTMRKNIFLVLLVTLMLALSACGNKGKVKVYENTEDVAVTHTEATMTAVVTKKDFENNIFSFVECVSGEEYEIAYHGGVNVYNIYGDAVDIKEVYNGSVVDVVYYSDTMKLVSLTFNDSVTTLKAVNKFSADPENNLARYKGTTCDMSDYVVAYDKDVPIDIREVNTEDQVTLNIYRNKLVSVVVELGHGYVRLKNHDTYIGGFVEIGYDVIVPVTEDMLITVREGEYTLRITKNGYSQSKDVKVYKGQETQVDLTSIAIPTGTVIFNITPADATLYVSGNSQGSHSYTNVYGTYGIKIVADGYKTFRGSVEISDSVKTYNIKLVKLADEEEDTTEETTEETTDTTTEATTEATTQSEDDTQSEDSSDTTSEEITTEANEPTDNIITINEPVNVDVYVDGEYVGVAPISFPKTVGSHTITLYKSGYLIKSYTIYASNNGKDDEYSFDELISLYDAID